MLTTRLLPPEDWDRLRALDPYATRGLPEDPENWRILVVERDGVLVGTCALFNAVHWDCWWIAPEARGRGGVLAQLLRASVAVFQEAGLDTVWTGVEDANSDVTRLLTHFGFQPAPGRLFVLSVASIHQQFSKEA